MGKPRTKMTAQGQISIPAEMRRRVGLGPGSVVEWDEQDGKLIAQKVGKYTFEDIHRRLFPDGPPKRRTIEEMDEGIAEYMRKHHARR